MDLLKDYISLYGTDSLHLIMTLRLLPGSDVSPKERELIIAQSNRLRAALLEIAREGR